MEKIYIYLTIKVDPDQDLAKYKRKRDFSYKLSHRESQRWLNRRNLMQDSRFLRYFPKTLVTLRFIGEVACLYVA